MPQEKRDTRVKPPAAKAAPKEAPKKKAEKEPVDVGPALGAQPEKPGESTPKNVASPPPHTAPVARKVGGTPEFVIDYRAFTNTADWPLYTPSEYVRAKQLAEPASLDGKKVKEGDYVVVSRDHKTKVVGRDEFESTYEQVKGPHKREF